MIDFILNFLRGIAVGIANIIPGVSGGTMAVILGIYENLTSSIGNVITQKNDRWKNLVFLFSIGAGAVTGVFLLAHIFTVLLEGGASKQYTYFFFIGLIVGSIPFILKLHNDMKITPLRVLSFLAAVTGIVITAYFGSSSVESDKIVATGELWGIFKLSDISLGYSIWLIVCGILGAGAMVLPGFSGSALLVSLGEYDNILSFIDQRMIIPIILVGAGIIPGIIVVSKLISYLLKKFPAGTYYFIIGLLIASIFQIYHEISGILELSIVRLLLSCVTLTAGFLSAFLLSKINKR